MSAFANMFAARGAPLDANFGEMLEVRHVGAGQFLAASGDPMQPPFDAFGILDLVVAITDGRGEKTAARSEMVTPTPQVDFAITQFGDGRPAPVPGSLIAALSRPGSPMFRVLDVLPSEDGRAVYQLAKL